MNLTNDQRDILEHVIANGINRQNEGDFAKMQGLARMGYMKDWGNQEGCGTRFFAVTKAGLKAFEAHE